ncbi:hypothetical protein CR969_03100 [Candidatus Saccharibacteria bacterium]|nr:MAG: hypothetical protein CR969_03100 [Candidatus Saccharibacteria bacterium]
MRSKSNPEGLSHEHARFSAVEAIKVAGALAAVALATDKIVGGLKSRVEKTEETVAPEETGLSDSQSPEDEVDTEVEKKAPHDRRHRRPISRFHYNTRVGRMTAEDLDRLITGEEPKDYDNSDWYMVH